METTSVRRRNTIRPVIKVWNQAKNLDYREKLELVTMLIESVKLLKTVPQADIPNEVKFSDMEKELYTPEEAYELTMKDIKSVYESRDAI